jgi:hypothetical protein
MEPMPPLRTSQSIDPPRAKRVGNARTAFVTAAASLGPAATYSVTLVRTSCTRASFDLSRTFIPANITGWLIPNSLVSGVDNTGFDGDMVVASYGGLHVVGMEQAEMPDHNQVLGTLLWSQKCR